MGLTSFRALSTYYPPVAESHSVIWFWDDVETILLVAEFLLPRETLGMFDRDIIEIG